jgi:hypothetical protein
MDARATSEMGQKRRLGHVISAAAWPPKADLSGTGHDFRFGPVPDSCTAQKLGKLLDTSWVGAWAQDVVRCGAVKQITLTESCPKTGDVPRSPLPKKMAA